MPPTILEALGLGSTSIQFLLSPPHPYYAAYEVTGYRIGYKNLGVANELYQTKEFPAGTMTANLTGLDGYGTYCLSALAITSKGPGIYGPCTTVMIGKGGKSEKNIIKN